MEGESSVVVVARSSAWAGPICEQLATSDIDVAAVVYEAEKALALAEETAPGLALVDAGIDGDVPGLIRSLSETEVVNSVVVVASTRSRQEFLTVVEAGAVGYLFPGALPERVVHALECVADGGAWLAPRLARTVLEELWSSRREAELHERGPLCRLTPKQWQVLGQMRRGMSTQQMADELVVTPATVRSHVSDILHALGARDRTEALELVQAMVRNPS